MKALLRPVIIWQMAIVAITALAITFVPWVKTYLGGGPDLFKTHPLILARANFEGNQYISIAHSGYGAGQQSYFPLFPALIRTVESWINFGALEQHFLHATLVSVSISLLSFTFA